MKKLVDPTISKELFKWPHEVEVKLDFIKWQEFVNSRMGYFKWFEETSEGINLKLNITKFPSKFRKKLINKLNNTQALAEFNEEKGYHEVVLMFNKELGIITTTFQRKIEPHHLYTLLEMADYLDAFLLNNGSEIIDVDYIKSVV